MQDRNYEQEGRMNEKREFIKDIGRALIFPLSIVAGSVLSAIIIWFIISKMVGLV